MNAFGKTSALGFLISITILVPDSSCSSKGKVQEPGGYQPPEPWDYQVQEPLDDQLQVPLDDQLQEPLFSYVNITISVQMGTKTLLLCPPVPPTKAVVITWVITLRGQPPCKISYRVETKETSETNCTDRRITWASTPDQSPDLQINAVALNHDGHYSCEIETPGGNSYERWDLQVLVPPAVTLFPGENRTAVCEATAGKPPAQISWTPEGYCKTKNESHSNGTVTVRSTCQWDHKKVHAVLCSVTHSTGNKILSIQLNQGVTSPLHSLLTILYVKLSLLGIILLIMGFAFFQKRNYFRK
ncbi:cell surface glycoprotein CD200 receptor 2-like isoform X1 [Peromyscus leucopus]|uniref:cell surface glycoprotein CD200 receptor 2-like isoform X1 n=1 Tax=Peromyscus leucopus TaxID=10041 RepID=UPI0018853A36|nr:cell surface glycoprotein CD200 receptor 2-like isoform X1 [Peromyscus leucopus]